MFFEYHQRNSDRLSPLNSTTLDNISFAGETSVKDLTGEIRQSLGGALRIERRSLLPACEPAGSVLLLERPAPEWLAGGCLVEGELSRTRLLQYNLDNDFFLFTPDLKNSRALHVGVAWKY